MSRGRLSALALWLGALAVLGNLFALAFLVHGEHKRQREQAAVPPAPAERPKPGEVILPTRQADSYLVEEVRFEKPWVEPLTVYGRVVPNPAATFELRAAFAGTVRAAGPWPGPGKTVAAGKPLGWVDVRVGPLERLDLQNKLNEASRRLEVAQKARQVQEERLKRIDKAPMSVPVRDREEAQLAWNDARNQEELARTARDLWKKALEEIGRPGQNQQPTWGQPLVPPAAGEVVEVAARPDAAVEAGALLLRLVDFRRVLVRLDLPPEALADGAPPAVELQTAGVPPPALRGAGGSAQPGEPPRKARFARVGPAPQVDPASQRVGYLYQVEAAGDRQGSAEAVAWRPGTFVKAELPAPQGEPRRAVSVPDTALLYHQGRAIVYVLKERRPKTSIFERREVQVLGRQGDRWVLAAGEFRSGQKVVSDEPQVLLSAEFYVDVD